MRPLPISLIEPRVRVIKKTIPIVALVCLTFAAAEAYAQTKIDPYLDLDSAQETAKALSISVIPPTAERKPAADVFIKTSDADKTRAAVHAAGGSVRAEVSGILTASIPADAIFRIAAANEVSFIEAAKPVSKDNDVAMAELGVPEVHAGTGLPSSYTGSGVVIGIIDTGIDYRHDDFQNTDGKSRILNIWDQTRQGGPAPTEIGDSYGTECSAQSIASGSCAMIDVDGHGTHVAGIAAGRDDTYGGVAPDANIIVVKYDSSLDLQSGYADAIFSTKICDAAYYVFAKAEALGMPAVVNLSLGTHIGAHDGTSLFEECLGGLTRGHAGRALVAAAGNEYSSDPTYTGIHAGAEVKDSTVASNFVIRSVTRDRIYYIDLWGTAGSNLSVGLVARSGALGAATRESSDMAGPAETVSGSFINGQVKYMINATETASALNGKQHVGIRIVLDQALTNPENYSFDLVVSGTGVFDAWLFPDKPSRSVQFTSVSGSGNGDWEYVPGDRTKSIAIPATARDVIAVAGYTTRNRWTASALTWTFSGQELGSILNFSSSGPTATPEATGVKPEIAAPGGMIASALSSSATVSAQTLLDDNQHFLQAGTSMAAPFVAGTIALMFQANPNFTGDDVEGFITQSAYADPFVGTAPNDRWGYGKLDILKAMEIAVNGKASGSFDVSGSATLPKDDSSGSSGGCSMASPVASQGSTCVELFLVAIGACAIAAMRRRVKIGSGIRSS